MGDSIFDMQAVPSSLVELQPFLRVAKEVEPGNSRVAYLCRFYAYDMAHRLDPISSGLGVRQFKDDLLQSLQRDNDLALKSRKEKSDAQEMQLFYLHYCDKFIHTLQNGVDKTNHAQLAKLNQTVDVLFGVVRAINRPLNVEYDQAVFEMHNNIEEKRKLYDLDIIPPVDPENTGQASAQQFFTYPGPSISRGEAQRDNVFIMGTPEEIADSERWDQFSTSVYNGLIFRDRMDIKCMPANVLDQMVHDISAEPISIPLALLQDITENFADERKIGQGGFGVVYKGVLPNGCVAVKKLLNSKTIDDVLFYRETNFLMSVKHQNIVRFLGYCANTENIAIKVDGSGKCGNYMYPELRERLLCFEYVSKGSLHNHLTDELRGLEWHIRYQIIKGICEGLQYLHKEKDIVHMDLKPDNILMDDLMIPKITDFGISKHLDGISQAVTKGHHMSLGYCAPEYLHRGQVSFKSDIFSLGVIIIDLVTGRKEDPDIKNVLRRWRYRWNRSAKYPTLGYQQVTKCIEIALRCVSHDPKERPYISDIIRELNEMESTDEHINSANEFSFSLISPYPWELLDIDPLELHFPFEAEKQIPCSLQLSNPRDDYIAFYIQTSSRQYCIEPNKGIVLPQSKSNVIITLQAQKEPRHLMYKDDFLVRCIVVNDDLRAENITKDMFDEKSSEMVDNVNLTVCDELPPPSSCVAA
ncbi:uncharacterized protein [Lolium perenne]|uniref:uncharacterized protein n=1 Tax=Lolium perenne TaxID=4522 RepID=UPI003A99D912